MSLKTAVKKIIYGTGYYHLKCRLNHSTKERLLIIMYHDLVDDGARATDWTQRAEPSVSQFRSQLIALKKRARILTVVDAMNEIREYGRLKERTIAITFDDGLESNYRLGWPVLKELNIPVTIFLPTDWINGRMSFWWQTLSDTLKQLDGARVSATEVYVRLGLEAPEESHSLVGGDARLRLYYELEDRLRLLQTRDAEKRVERLSDLPHDPTLGPSPETRPMTWDQIREMSRHGIQFGAHTVSHPNLSFVDKTTAEKEFRESKLEIERQLDKPVVGLAFPYGVDYHAYTGLVDTVKRAGFVYSLTAVAGYNDHSTNPYLLRRINLPLTSSRALIGRELLLDYLMDNHAPLSKIAIPAAAM